VRRWIDGVIEYFVFSGKERITSEMKRSFYGFCHWMLVYG